MKSAHAVSPKPKEKIPIRLLLRDRHGNTENHIIYATYGDNLLDVISRHFNVVLKSNELGIWITAICGKKVRISEDMHGGLQFYVNNMLPYVIASANPFFLGLQNIRVTSELKMRMQYDPYLQDITVPAPIKIKAVLHGLFGGKDREAFGECSSCSAPFDESMRKSLCRMVSSHEMSYLAVEAPPKEGIPFVGICCSAPVWPRGLRVERSIADASRLVQHGPIPEIALEREIGRVEIAEQPQNMFLYCTNEGQNPLPMSEALPVGVGQHCISSFNRENSVVELGEASSTSAKILQGKQETVHITVNPIIAKDALVRIPIPVRARPSQEQTKKQKRMPSAISGQATALIQPTVAVKVIAGQKSKAKKTNFAAKRVDFAAKANLRPGREAQQMPKMALEEIIGKAAVMVGQIARKVKPSTEESANSKVMRKVRARKKPGNDRMGKVKPSTEESANGKVMRKVRTGKKPGNGRMGKVKPSTEESANGKVMRKVRTGKKPGNDVRVIFALDRARKNRLKSVSGEMGIWPMIRSLLRKMIRFV